MTDADLITLAEREAKFINESQPAAAAIMRALVDRVRPKPGAAPSWVTPYLGEGTAFDPRVGVTSGGYVKTTSTGDIPGYDGPTISTTVPERIVPRRA